MGNLCVKDEQAPCCPDDTRTKYSEGNQHRITQKDLVHIKNFRINQQYTLLSPPIGRGSFGSVYKAIHRSSGIVRAAKRIEKAHKTFNDVEEFSFLKKLDHPNIIRILDIFVQETFIYIVTEFCTGGELFDRIIEEKTLTENQARHYMKQILSAVAYCHANHIMHRDLKPQNVMFTAKGQNSLKIIDFGASTYYRQENATKTKVGSVFYIAPEVIKKNYNEKCDVWSMGVIMFIMLSGTPPFTGRTDQAIFKKILSGRVNYPQSKWKRVSAQAKDLLTRMLEQDPEKRISARQALNHPWFLFKVLQNGSQNLFQNSQLDEMVRFCNASRFQQGVISYISHHLLASEALNELANKFKIIDKNNDGRISWKQFRECYMTTVGQTDEKQLYSVFERLDKNKSGFVDYSEYISSALKREMIDGKELLEKVFKAIDRDENGLLDKDEILYCFGGVSESLHQQIIKECDLNNDGVISKEEFMKAMQSIQGLEIQKRKGKLKKHQSLNI